MKIAKIIVDIPLMQTDKPFTYQIPKELSALTEVGMRVHVPFGAGNRLVQGIIVEILEHLISSKATSGLKKIAELLDVTPVLTKEQLWLADEMRHRRIAQLLIQRDGPQVIVGNNVLNIAGLIHHAVASQIIRHRNLLHP